VGALNGYDFIVSSAIETPGKTDGSYRVLPSSKFVLPQVNMAVAEQEN
jgi:hypothetical protein